MSKTQQLKQFLATPTVRLAAIHLAIIMLLSVSFSVVFYNTSDRQFSRPIGPFSQSMFSPPGGFTKQFDSQVRTLVDERLNQTREALLVRLIWINLGAIFFGSIVSYFLARWSLRPIEEAMEAQTQFVSDASHELRTPLTVLQTTNEIALRKQKLPAAEARELISHNVEEVKKLRDLSNTLLDLLKNSNEPAPLEPVDLQDVVSEAMSSVVVIAQDKNITIEDTVPKLQANTNKALLARIVAVLLDNAVKYSKYDGQVVISANQAGKKVVLHVTDQGIGIRASDLPLIFRRFYRADKSRSSTDVQGYGLGLSIADKIATQLGAKLVVKSTPGRGSTFTVELPAVLGLSNGNNATDD